MKSQRTHIARFLVIFAMALIGVYVSLKPIQTVGADSTNKAAPSPSAALPVRSTLHGPGALKHLEQTGLYSSLSAAMTAAHYRIEEGKAGGYEASNPKQGYRTVFTPAGVEVSGTGRNGSDWRLGMKLTGYGYGQRKQAVTFAAVKAKDERVEYERRAYDGGSISEWYVNRGTGLEQGFTIPEAPAQRKAGERLNLWLELSGDLQARLAEKGQAILLNGRAASLRYDKLHAFDANGRELEARMKLSGGQVILEVADESAVYPLTIDPTLAQEAKLTASDAAGSDFFGFSVAIDGETAVVGSRGDDTAAGTNAGSAYVFVRSGTSWSQQAKLTASDAAGGDNFGRNVVDISGDTFVVGSPLDDTGAGSDTGSAYVFVRSGTSWSQQAKLTASDAATFDLFGLSVGISGDTVVVGALLDDDDGLDSGSAYVFVRSGTSWSQQQKLTASDAAIDDQFGISVSISGNTVVVGAFSDDDGGANSGSAYVFAPPSNQAPDCSGATPSISTIWPPNHDMINVTIQGVTDPDGDPVTINIDAIKQDEPTDGTGDGHTCPDGDGIGTSTAQVRAERSASPLSGNGRVYTIYFTASDGQGGSCQGSVTVCVPRTRNGSCTDDGPDFDSTACAGALNLHPYSIDGLPTAWTIGGGDGDGGHGGLLPPGLPLALGSRRPAVPAVIRMCGALTK